MNVIISPCFDVRPGPATEVDASLPRRIRYLTIRDSFCEKIAMINPASVLCMQCTHGQSCSTAAVGLSRMDLISSLKLKCISGSKASALNIRYTNCSDKPSEKSFSCMLLQLCICPLCQPCFCSRLNFSQTSSSPKTLFTSISLVPTMCLYCLL